MAKESLFDSLLNPKEDSGSTKLENYFTKIVAHLFKTSPEILYAWLKHIELIDNTDHYVQLPIVSSQKYYHALPYHLKNSIIDIEIKLSGSGFYDVLFIESKIDAIGGYDQLKRYAEHLHAKNGMIKQKFLLYVTRDYDKKDEAEVLRGVPELAVHFPQPIRWYTLQETLQKQPKNPLLDEIIIFMDKHGMGLNKGKLTQEVERVNLSGANLSGAGLQEVDLSKCNLSQTNLTGANLREANLSGINLQGANLQNADLYRADLRGAKIDDTTQIEEKWRRIQRIVTDGVSRDLSGGGPDLSGSDFSGGGLQGIDLSWCILQDANLSGANLNRADLQGTNLIGADLCGATLSGANLFKADIRRLKYLNFVQNNGNVPGFKEGA